MDMGDFDQAREFYTQYFKSFFRPDDKGKQVAKVLEAIGVCHLRAGKRKEALPPLQKACKKGYKKACKMVAGIKSGAEFNIKINIR